MQEEIFHDPRQAIYTVTQLTRELKEILESRFASVWVTGEISNFHAHSSGHFYFTLKDAQSQLSAVMFRGANRLLKFRPENGLEVIANGRISLYEPRGQYQMVLESLEPKGLGALQLAFDQLRKKLEGEGLFDTARKRPLPPCPQRIGIITSPTGAVIRDMIHILKRRFPIANILLYPVTVQGESAAPEIARAIEQMNRQGESEVLIVGRGGGSLEDLWAFNTEVVARAMAASKIPIVSAVGHETDFTIGDFVADLRAPTPSAAAEMVVPVLQELKADIALQRHRLAQRMTRLLAEKKESLKYWHSHLKHPQKRIEELSLRLDDLVSRMSDAMRRELETRRHLWRHLVGKLEVLSPLSILSRGYSITRKSNPDGSEGSVVKDANQVKEGEIISIQLMKGALSAQIRPRKSP